MALVNYSDSDSDSDSAALSPKQKNDGNQRGPATKKRKISSTPSEKSTLPPLPQSFRDLYSSTVRTSTVDDPALHGGRKRVIPHVHGNWPAHVYLEWTPTPEEYSLLGCIIDQQKQGDQSITSLLQTPLSVPLPLHISLSRPLTLSTPQKDPFLASLTSSLQKSGVRAFNVAPKGLNWHGNEEGTRWFLVLRVESAEGQGELGRLLETSNGVCRSMSLPELYTESLEGRHGEAKETNGKRKGESDGEEPEGKMHISVAWSLSPPPTDTDSAVTGSGADGLPDEARGLRIPFREVKVRIGQDVTSVPLGAARGNPKSKGEGSRPQ